MEFGDDLGLCGKIHGRIGIFPAAQNAQAFELLALDIDPFGSKFAAAFAKLGLGHIALGPALIAEFFLDLPFDRQAMTVPARDIIHIKAKQEPRPDDKILQDLIEGMANMDLAIGIGRAVMQDKQGCTGILTGLAHGLIQLSLRPAGEDFRLFLRQAAAHRKGGIGQEHRVAKVAAGLGTRSRIVHDVHIQ